MKGFKYVLGKKDGRKDLHIYAARRTVRRDLHMYAARRTEESIYICTRQEGRKKGFTYARGEKDGKRI